MVVVYHMYTDLRFINNKKINKYDTCTTYIHTYIHTCMYCTVCINDILYNMII